MQFTCVRGTKRVVIPMRKGELKRKALRAIIQDLKISVEEFGKLP
jgi:predicted RNA binding protein YcfA (HicA-like mRNA interferase family)